MRLVMRRRAESGSSLIELLAALALFGLIAAATLRALDRQTRFHGGATRLLESRSQLAAVHEAMAAELRSVAGAAGDVRSITDTSIVYRQQVGGGIACAMLPGSIDLVPERLAGSQVLTRFTTAPQSGDTAWILDEGPVLSAADDQWVPAGVVSAARVAGACVGTPFIDPAADGSATGWRLTLATAAVPSTAVPGTAVRLTRLARFALYRSSTGDSFLGWTDWNATTSAWNVIQPVAGPLAGYRAARPWEGGLALRAWDSLGASVLPGAPAPVARVAIMARSVTRGVVRADGMARGIAVDSLATTLTLRNMR